MIGKPMKSMARIVLRSGFMSWAKLDRGGEGARKV